MVLIGSTLVHLSLKCPIKVIENITRLVRKETPGKRWTERNSERGIERN